MIRKIEFKSAPLRVVSLFSGIGGFERAFEAAGHTTLLMCDSDPAAQAVLAHRFPNIPIEKDVTSLKTLPECDVVTAGWPCQDISLAGQMRGLEGDRSGLISEVFRLLQGARRKPKYVLLENVAFALDLRRGESVRYVTKNLEELGYHWAYRVLDTQAFGLPQRRRRLFILGAMKDDPATILLDGIQTSSSDLFQDPAMVGFYWTEGNRGLGWSPEAVPPLKGGSGLSIPSPPAIWHPSTSTFFVPSIVDAERLQGFPENWTAAANELPKGARKRWSLVGNAVSVPVVEWIAQRIATADRSASKKDWNVIESEDRLPRASYGGPGGVIVNLSAKGEGPSYHTRSLLSEFGILSPTPASYRSIAGFTRRFEVAPLRKNEMFLRDLRRYLATEAA